MKSKSETKANLAKVIYSNQNKKSYYATKCYQPKKDMLDNIHKTQ